MNNKELDDHLSEKFRDLRRAEPDRQFAGSVMQRIDAHAATSTGNNRFGDLVDAADGYTFGASHSLRERAWVVTFAVVLGGLVGVPSLQSMDLPTLVLNLFSIPGLSEWASSLSGLTQPTSVNTAAYALVAAVLAPFLVLFVLEE